MEQNEKIWDDMVKQAGIMSKVKAVAKPGFLGKVHPTVPPVKGVLNYADMRASEVAKARAKPGATLSYNKGQAPTYTAPGKSMEESKAIGQAKAQQHFQNRVKNITKGGYTDPQIRREM